MIYICERGYKERRGQKIFRGEEQRKRKRTIATKVVQVCFSLLLEFLPIFFVCSFLNILTLLIGVNGKGHKFVVLRSVPDIYYTLIRILSSLILLLIPKHHLYQYECHDH